MMLCNFLKCLLYDRKSKEYGQNYIDRIRLEEDAFQNTKNQSKSLGWRHDNSISHLDLATSCHNFASNINSWHPLCLSRHQLRHSRSLDYNHIDTCKDAVDIDDYYWYINSDTQKYEEEFEPTSVDVNFVSGHHLVQQPDLGGYNYASSESKPHLSQNNIYQVTQNQNQPQSITANAIPAGFEFSSDSCSLRRSRSLAVIREETYNDLQIPSSINNCRRSQLIPRAHLVNRTIFREHDRLIFSNGKQYPNQILQEKLGNERTNVAPKQDEQQSNNECNDAHQQKSHLSQCVLYDHCHHCRGGQLTGTATDTYYDNLKRLDGLCDQMHPWHNEKSDLESLNSDYFKNSLHQPKELQQQQQQQQRLEFEVIDKNFATNEKPRIYQSRRQQLQRCITDRLHHKLTAATIGTSGGESCHENSQSSVFPESTPSITDEQSDSASLSEQEYDITKVEKLFKKNESEIDKNYEFLNLISGGDYSFKTADDIDQQYGSQEQLQTTKSAEAAYTDDLDIQSYSTLTIQKQKNDNFQKIIAYDSVYLSSEEGSESTLLGKGYDNSLDAISLKTCSDDMKALLHISIEDPLYEPKAKQYKVQIEAQESGIDIRKELVDNEVRNFTANKSKSTTEIDETYNNPSSSIVHSQLVSNYTILHKNGGDEDQYNAHDETISVSVSPNSSHKSNFISLAEARIRTRIINSPEFDDTNGILRSSNKTDASKKCISSHYKFRGNQYCSLPDVNISQSLHVSESIDAQLRSSYNSDNYSSSNGIESVSFSIKNAGGNCDDSNTEVQENIIIEEIYDTIKRCAKDFRDSDLISPGIKKCAHDLHKNADNAVVRSRSSTNLTPVNPTCENHTEEIIKSNANVKGPLPTAANSFNCLEKPKEVLTIEVDNFSQQIERKAKEILEGSSQNKLSPLDAAGANKLHALQNPNTSTPFRIIVTDVQNNVIEEDCIAGGRSSKTQSQSSGESHSQQTTNDKIIKADAKITQALRNDHDSIPQTKVLKANTVQLGGSTNKVSTLRRIYSKHKRQHCHLNSFYHKENFESKRLSLSPKPKKSSILNSQIYRARPVKVLSLREPQNSLHSKTPTLSHKSIEKDRKTFEPDTTSNKNLTNHDNSDEVTAFPKRQVNKEETRQAGDELKCVFNHHEGQAKVLTNNNEFLAKDELSAFLPSVEVVELEGNKKATIVSTVAGNELADSTSATQAFDHIRYKVLKPQQLLRGSHLTRTKKAAQFDGLIQYLQEYSFQELLSNNNVVIVEPVRTKIEQPLQTTNAAACLTMPAVNIVNSSLKRNQTTIPANRNDNHGDDKRMLRDNKISPGIKRHFFYQPVRVNRELHEDELPNPDTVRNVCKFFEEHVLATPGAANEANTSLKSIKTAKQVLSTRTRRLRKQRYLTIDAPYDYVIPTKSNYEFTSSSKWQDSRFTSSGSFSNWNLSLPFESIAMDTHSTKQRPNTTESNKQTDETLRVHVQDIIRKHNRASLSSAINAASNCNNSLDDNNPGSDSKYECRKQCDLSDTVGDLYNDDNDEEREKFSKSHYISNDVLKKIREYGSSVTYYGGRVVQSNNYQEYSNIDNSHDRCTAKAYAVLIPLQLSLQTNTQTQYNGSSTIEFVDNGINNLKSKNADCMESKSVKILHHKVLNNERKQLIDCNVCDNDNDKEILFKLVKSNSCNSRLELEGALNSNTNGSEIVRKMVHKFEEENKSPSDGSPAVQNNHAKSALKSFPLSSQPLMVKNSATSISHVDDGKNCEYLNTRLENLQSQDCCSSSTGNNYQISCTKLYRNKNVDLAFTLAKQNLVQSNSVVAAAPPCQRNIKAGLIANTSEEEQTNGTLDTENLMEKTSTNQHIKFNQKEKLHPNEHNSFKAKAKSTGSCQNYSISSNSCHMNTLSTLDKSLVKHYVTNDKSIYNKHRFDDIKFEEFEVYDPTTDFEKFAKQNILKSKKISFECNANESTIIADNEMKDSQSHYHHQPSDDNNSTATDTDCYDSLDDKL